MSESKISLYEKIRYMRAWAVVQGLELQLKGEVGFGRPCVGILSMIGGDDDGTYPDYDFTGCDYSIWLPDRAYHKHPCVAVLGRDDESILQLYDWVKWFDENRFIYVNVKVKRPDAITAFFHGHYDHYIIKPEYRHLLPENSEKSVDED